MPPGLPGTTASICKFGNKIMKLLMVWYGEQICDRRRRGYKVPVKLDGNRRVLVYREDPQNVIVRIQDILHPSTNIPLMWK